MKNGVFWSALVDVRLAGYPGRCGYAPASHHPSGAMNHQIGSCDDESVTDVLGFWL